jgi:hypothetical protein
MFYKVSINVPTFESEKFEAFGINELLEKLNERLPHYNLSTISHQDLSRVVCNSKDTSKRIRSISQYLLIEKKRCKQVRVTSNTHLVITQ